MNPLTGVWRLISFDLERQDTGALRPAFGKNPSGRVAFLASGVMIVLITPGQRATPQSVDDRAAAYHAMVAYTGRFTVEGDQLTTDVDIAWNAAWLDVPQIRTIAFKGDQLELRSNWQPSLAEPGVAKRGVLLWERED